jgi:hypothetical protein
MRFYSLDRSMGRRLRPWLAPIALLASLACASALAHNTNNSSITTGHASTKPKTSIKPTTDTARMKLQGPGPEAVKVSARQSEPRLAPLPQAVPLSPGDGDDGPHGMMLATLVMMAVIAVRRQSARKH